MVGLSDLRGLFQPQGFYGPMVGLAVLSFPHPACELIQSHHDSQPPAHPPWRNSGSFPLFWIRYLVPSESQKH